MITAKFNFGQLVMTAETHALATSNPDFAAHVGESMRRYFSCDWGDICSSDAELNDKAVAGAEDRIMGVYKHPEHDDWKIWIITEWDRSVTTILFPHEY